MPFKKYLRESECQGKAGAEKVNLGHLHIDDISSHETT